MESPEAEAPSDADREPQLPTEGKTAGGEKLAAKPGTSRKALPGRLRKKLANDRKKAAPKP